MGVDVDQPGLYLGNANGIAGGFRLVHQSIALEVRFQYDLKQALRTVGRLLGEAADAPAGRNSDGPGFGGQIAADCAKQR